MPLPLVRHDRVWLSPTIAAACLRQAPERERLVRWIEGGRALVVRRRDASLLPSAVALGLTLPVAEGRARIASVVDREAIVRTAPPLLLGEVLTHAPRENRAALRGLERVGAALGTSFAVYGSYAWQAISNESCVTPDSDIDLLWAAGDAQHVRRVIDLLLEWERTSGIRADGEVRFPNGDAIAWRELTTGASRVLVKRDDGVALVPMPAIR